MAEVQEKGDHGSHSSQEKQGTDGHHIAKVEDVDTYAVLPKGSVDPVYQAKAKVLNDAIQAIGMGRYQVSILQQARFRTSMSIVLTGYRS
jgi:hypothetical protein